VAGAVMGHLIIAVAVAPDPGLRAVLEVAAAVVVAVPAPAGLAARLGMQVLPGMRDPLALLQQD
jgi:hypothetical protein